MLLKLIYLYTNTRTYISNTYIQHISYISNIYIYIDISKAFDRVYSMLVFFTNLSLMEFQVRYLALFVLFLVIDGFESFWMESVHKNIQLMLELLKAPSLVLHFSYYTLMTFLTILLSILNVIRHLICDNNLNWLLNLNLIYETL